MTLKQRLGKVVVKLMPLTRENFDLFRFELNAIMVRTGCLINPVKRQKIKRLLHGDNFSVNVGAGPFGEEGWINIDVFNARNISFTYDCRKKLPFPDNSVARIRCEHVLEHLDRQEETPLFLKECLRCLKVGGVLRIIVPDAGRFAIAYRENTDEIWAGLGITKAWFNDDWTPMDALNKIFRQGGEHKFGFDLETMKITLSKAGFARIYHSAYQQSLDEKLNNDQEIHHLHSLYVECVK